MTPFQSFSMSLRLAPPTGLGARLALALTLLLALAPGQGGCVQTNLRVGIYYNSPLTLETRTGDIKGFVAGLLDTIAAREGWRLDYVSCDWPECLRLLQTREIDLLTPIAYTRARAARFDFNHENLLVNWGRIVARNDWDPHSLLDLKGRAIVVVKGDTHYARLKEVDALSELHLEFIETASYQEVLHAVANGKAQAGLVNRLFVADGGEWMRGVHRTDIVFHPVPIRIALPKGNPANPSLIAALDHHLALLKEAPDSIYYQSMEHWLEHPPLAEPWPTWLGIVLAAAALLVLVLGLSNFLLELRVRNRTRSLQEEIGLRRDSELALEMANAQYRLAATAFESHDGIIITDDHCRIQRVNDAFARITGYTPEEVMGKTPAILRSGRQDQAYYRRMWTAIRDQGGWQGKIWNRRKNGEVYPEWLRITAVTDTAGAISHYVGLFTDFSEVETQRLIIECKVAEEQALGAVLRLSLQPLGLEQYLRQALATLLASIPWAQVQQKGGIFLSESGPDGPRPQLAASYNLSPKVQTQYADIEIGRCLCGRAADTKEIQFYDHVDERHEIRCPGMPPHGHYSVPILADDQVLGVLVLYLDEGYRPREHESEFLKRVADAFGMGISRRFAAREIEQLAYFDPLTNLPNRRMLLDRLHQDLALAERRGIYGAVLFLDLDRFKTLNDALGHAVGDGLLQQVAERLREVARTEDSVARLGGDEFVVVLPELGETSSQAVRSAQVASRRLQAALARPYDLDGHRYHMTFSMGIALFPEDHHSAEAILRGADTAMYKAKAERNNTIRFFEPRMQAEADERLVLEKDLLTALELDQLRLYYQPQFDAAGAIIGAEALVRWQHPTRGLVLPDSFIRVAEETGLILQLGHWVLRHACTRLRAWQDTGHGRNLRHLAVNVSPLQFHQPGFVEEVGVIIKDTSIDPSRLALEITESMLITNIDAVIDKMHRLKALGISLSIDDFGTGYSSLTYLKRLPIDVLKIDKSFVQQISSSPCDAAIIETIISMAGHLGLNTVAEGVETEAQLQFLERHGCPVYQGYWFSRPVPPEALDAMLDAKGGNS